MNGINNFTKHAEVALFPNKVEAAASENAIDVARAEQHPPAVAVSPGVWKVK